MTGVVVWVTGLPSSGKTTLAERIAARLEDAGRPRCVLDGDAVRACLVPRPGYDDEGRDDFYATLANLAGLIADQGLVVLVPATAHRRSFRERARDVASRYLEVYVATPASECQRRDDKGLYAQSERGDLSTDLPGVAASYDAPRDPDVVASGGRDDEAVERIVALVGTS